MLQNDEQYLKYNYTVNNNIKMGGRITIQAGISLDDVSLGDDDTFSDSDNDAEVCALNDTLPRGQALVDSRPNLSRTSNPS